MATQDTETDTVRVDEEKFNGTATLTVTGVESKDHAEAFAKRYFKDKHSTRPGRAVAEEYYHTLGDATTWRVVVTDHSSGSLVDSKWYDHPDADTDDTPGVEP